MKIIGISGKKQSGKTTAVNDLRLKMHGCVGVDFADALKEVLIVCFIAPSVSEVDRAFLDKYKFIDERFKQTLHPCGKTYRELLQLVGTDWFRSIWPDVWVENYKLRIAEEDEPVIITSDVRFLNEVKCIQDLGGHVIRLLRAPFPDDKHESETALDVIEYDTRAWGLAHLNIGGMPPKPDLLFDAIIDNRKMTIEEQNEAVWKLVNEKGWI